MNSPHDTCPMLPILGRCCGRRFCSLDCYAIHAKALYRRIVDDFTQSGLMHAQMLWVTIKPSSGEIGDLLTVRYGATRALRKLGKVYPDLRYGYVEDWGKQSGAHDAFLIVLPPDADLQDWKLRLQRMVCNIARCNGISLVEDPPYAELARHVLDSVGYITGARKDQRDIRLGPDQPKRRYSGISRLLSGRTPKKPSTRAQSTKPSRATGKASGGLP